MLLIKNGTVVDPVAGINGIRDILIDGGRVAEVGRNIGGGGGFEIVNAAGMYVMPGFVDLHEHFREPGYTYKETVKTGSAAAAKGGFTSVFVMPNTDPVIDCAESCGMLMDIIKRDACVNVYPVGAITKGQKGKELVDIKAMAESGIRAISEDGKSVMDSALCRKAMEIAKDLDIPVFAHCEDINLARGGVMNEGARAEALGLSGIPNSAEDIIAARDIMLAKQTGTRLHLCHVSTRDSVRMLRLAKEEGIRVTGEACPHHFTLSDEDIPKDDADYKMNPPLRAKADVDAVIEGIRDKSIDAIATDHAPHSESEKKGSMKNAPFGIVGSETAFPLAYTELVCKGVITLSELVWLMSAKPAEIAGIEGGSISPGMPADIVIADLNAEYGIDRRKFLSKGKNTPFDGRRVKGAIKRTFVAGREVAYD